MAYEAKKLLEELEALQDADPWYKKALAMYNSGAFDREVMRELKLTPAKWRVLESDRLESNFAEIVELGRMLSQAWWEEQARVNLHNPKFQQGLYTFMMKSRFGYADKADSVLTAAEIDNKDDATLIREIRELNKRLKESGRDIGVL